MVKNFYKNVRFFLYFWSKFSIKVSKIFYYFGYEKLVRDNLQILFESYRIMKGGMIFLIKKEYEKNSRQMPATSTIVREKDYCDLLYAWLQCNSERIDVNSRGRRILKSKVKWTAIERDFTRKLIDGSEEKVMSRKTIAKYFQHLLDKGLIFCNDDEFYYLTVLDQHDANLIEYETLSKLMNVLQKNSISIYNYLFNRYFASGKQPFVATIKQVKDFIGIATTTTSNNAIVSDTIDILKRLELLDYKLIITEDNKTLMEFQWVRNKLP